MFLVCDNYRIMSIIYMIKVILGIACIFVPILLIFLLVQDLAKAEISIEEEKVLKKRVIIRLVAALFIFTVPIITSVFLSVIGKEFDVETLTCYKDINMSRLRKLKKDEKSRKLKDKKQREGAISDGQSRIDETNRKRREIEKENAKKALEEKKKEEERIKKEQEEKRQKEKERRGGEQTPIDDNLDTTIFVGDSRTVGVYASFNPTSSGFIDEVSGVDIFYAKNGAGLSWFRSSALSKLQYYLGGASYNVIINMGTNDLLNQSAATSYIGLYNSLATSYPNSKFIIVSINPIDDYKARQSGYQVTNEHVKRFNQILRNNMPSRNNLSYCDINDKLGNDYTSSDGIHYDIATYKRIYSLSKNCI